MPNYFQISPVAFVPFGNDVFLSGTVRPRDTDKLVIAGTARYQADRRCRIGGRTEPLVAHSFAFSVTASPHSVGAYSIGVVDARDKPFLHITHILKSCIPGQSDKPETNVYLVEGNDNDGKYTGRKANAQVLVDQGLKLAIEYSAQEETLKCSAGDLLIHQMKAKLETFRLEIGFEISGVGGEFEIIFGDLFYDSLDNRRPCYVRRQPIRFTPRPVPDLPPSVLPKTRDLLDLRKLRLKVTKYFNESELRNLCFDMNIDYEDLDGNNKSDKARELIAYCERRKSIPKLVARLRKLRPRVSW